jgi:2,4-didehydro-3-deoxy-L-rhamnonate hydrolase
MQTKPFALGVFPRHDQRVLGIVVDGEAFALADMPNGVASQALARARAIEDVLEDWERNFPALQKAAERAHECASLNMDAACPPVRSPSKILCAAANYRAHVEEMRKSNYAGNYDSQKDFMGDRSRTRPYLFLKAPSSLCGPYDDIQVPLEQQTDWEAELVVVIGKRCRNVKAEKARDVIAGYMTGNDISCRTLLWREDRQTIRSDWLGSKSHDTFGPIGPFFVPREFIPDHNDLRIELKLNGVVKQAGSTREMIFSPDEQIEYASAMMTLEPGDLFFTGTVSGVGQGRGEFLRPGDVVECEVMGLGKQRNSVVPVAS